MKTVTLSDKFKCFIDAMYYGFQWKEAQYMDVEFSAIKKGDDVVVAVQNIKAEPWLIGAIVIRNNWMEVSKHIDDATLAHATKEFNRNAHVNETVINAIANYLAAPHI